MVMAGLGKYEQTRRLKSGFDLSATCSHSGWYAPSLLSLSVCAADDESCLVVTGGHGSVRERPWRLLSRPNGEHCVYILVLGETHPVPSHPVLGQDHPDTLTSAQ
jgi:hypothetical protein